MAQPPRHSPQVPEYIRTLVPYLPGKPIEETQREFKIRRVVKLASNENPLGPSPRALAAVKRALPDSHRYPDGSGRSLKIALARHLDVEPSHLILGNGSNEVIDFLLRTYCVPNDAVVTTQAAFIAYRICAQIQGVRVLESPIDADLNVDLNSGLESVLALVKRDESAKIVFLANPNNPTGTYVRGPELRKFLDAIQGVRGGEVIVALDYAYWEYVTAKDLPDPATLLHDYPNVIVLRTFSKVYGLAGFRVGYGVAAPEIIQSLEKVRQPFNLNTLAMVAAEAALGDKGFVKRALKANQVGKKFWEKTLKELGIPFWPSQGNFLLADVNRGLGKSGGEVYQSCLRRGVIFRPVANYGLLHALRISIGTMEENRFAARALAAEGSVKQTKQKRIR